MQCYEESILENKTNLYDCNINEVPHVIENSYLEISKHNLDDQSLICNDFKENLGVFCGEKINKLEDAEVYNQCLFIQNEVPDPRINFEQLQQINSKRPQTSYGGISARQRNRKISAKPQEKNEPLFPEGPSPNQGKFGMQNKLFDLNNKIN